MTTKPDGIAPHPRDAWITVYGRKPVMEVLEDPQCRVARVFIAKGTGGPVMKRIRAAAKAAGVEVKMESRERVSRISRHAKQDQGVAADVEAPRMMALSRWLEHAPQSARLLALDHVTTPGNVGMILRTATVLGLDGVIVPRRGVPEIGPLVIKASAGVAFRAAILRCDRIDDGLSEAKMAGFCVYGMADQGARGLADTAPRERSVFVLGNESDGVGAAVKPLVDEWVRIPMAQTGDSLNVAAAGAIVAYHLAART
ncbi:MAG: TrmH family RNA methyltransferase [Sandaracinaceae bacterium]